MCVIYIWSKFIIIYLIIDIKIKSYCMPLQRTDTQLVTYKTTLSFILGTGNMDPCGRCAWSRARARTGSAPALAAGATPARDHISTPGSRRRHA
jgi:hypothetical protein